MLIDGFSGCFLDETDQKFLEIKIAGQDFGCFYFILFLAFQQMLEF